MNHDSDNETPSLSSRLSLLSDLSEGEDKDLSQPTQTTRPTAGMDLGEAFNSIRNGLKLQGKSVRELQQSVGEALQRLEQRLAAQQTAPTTVPSAGELRKLAEAVTEIEETLQRAVEQVRQQAPAAALQLKIKEQVDQVWAESSWFARFFSQSLRGRIHQVIDQAVAEFKSPEATLASVFQGLDLLLARVRRLMQQNQLERVDVLQRPFDAETMRAIDIVDVPGLQPGHVAEQLRPLYLWRNEVLKFADVRLSR